MERLTKRLLNGTAYLATEIQFPDVVDRLAHYEDLEEQGRLREGTMEWISVEDRLPEMSGRYLLLSESGQMFDGGYDSCIDGMSCFGEWRSYYHPGTLGYLDSEWEPFEGITHWMPLPEPPKEDAE